MKKLTPQALKIIRSSGKLFGEIADHLGLAPVSLRDMVAANTDERLVSAGVENPRKLTPFRQNKLTPFGHFKLTPLFRLKLTP